MVMLALKFSFFQLDILAFYYSIASIRFHFVSCGFVFIRSFMDIKIQNSYLACKRSFMNSVLINIFELNTVYFILLCSPING